MDDRHFDVWTRRRFGLATGGVLATLLGLGAREGAAAKHHHHHHKPPRCTPTERPCGKQCVTGTCCPGKPCGAGCDCDRTTEGDTVCHNPLFIIGGCTTSADCTGDARCFTAARHCALSCGGSPD
jgi:hypothetical protein